MIVRNIVKFIHNTKTDHLIPILLYIVVYLIWFRIVEMIPRSHYMIIATPLDRIIPFCEVFVVPYLSWFPYIMAGTLLVYFLDRNEYDILITELMIGMTIFLVISTVFPNRQPMRLLEMPRNNLFTMIVTALWKVDTPTNVWPSIHVFNSLAIELSWLKVSRNQPRWKTYRIISVIWCVLICMSTVLVKQHSVWDIVTGAMLMVMTYLFVNVGGYVLTFASWDRWFAQKKQKILGDEI